MDRLFFQVLWVSAHAGGTSVFLEFVRTDERMDEFSGYYTERSMRDTEDESVPKECCTLSQTPSGS